MAEPFLAEIRVFTFNFAPRGWAQCNGQLLPIQQNQALYTLLGTKFGGDGQTTFGLPNLQGRVPINPSNTILYATSGGEAAHVLTVNEMPPHNHTIEASTIAPTQRAPAGSYWTTVSPSTDCYAPTSSTTMAATALGTAGGSQGHPNMQPYVVLNYCIALLGNYPSRP